ncbi:MAG TPA: DUF1579 domain-containing protein [Planctomycetota bacterium]|nr:DUF1579 domain-containing protein [Planctomycetota bacterium]
MSSSSSQDQNPAPPNPAEFEELTRPAAEHALLAKLAGRWRAQAKFWMAPHQPPMESEGSIVGTLVFGGRYLMTEFECSEGMFQGRGTLGYDKVRGEYVFSWFDTMATGITHYTGKATPDGQRLEVVGTEIDPQSNKPVRHRLVTLLEGENRHRWEMHSTAPGQPEFRAMEIVYTRMA